MARLFWVIIISLLCADGAAAQRSRPLVAIVVWDGVDVLDVSGPGQVLAAAGGRSIFRPFTVAATTETVALRGGMRVTPRFTFDNAPIPDVIIVPGTGPTETVGQDRLAEWITTIQDEVEIVLGVGTGVFVLARAGLLEDRQVATTPDVARNLRLYSPTTVVRTEPRWIDGGEIVTCGPGIAAMDATLHIVNRMRGEAIARRAAERIGHTWVPGESGGELARAADESMLTNEQVILATLVREGVDAAAAVYETRREVGDAPSEGLVNNLGYLYLRARQLDEAEAVFRLNVAVHPNAFNPWDSLGEALKERGRADEAIDYYLRSIELNPANSNGRAMLREILNTMEIEDPERRTRAEREAA